MHAVKQNFKKSHVLTWVKPELESQTLGTELGYTKQEIKQFANQRKKKKDCSLYYDSEFKSPEDQPAEMQAKILLAIGALFGVLLGVQAALSVSLYLNSPIISDEWADVPAGLN